MEDQFLNKFLQYLLSPAMTVAFMWFVLEKVYKLGELSQQFKKFQEDLQDLKYEIKELKKETARLVSHINIIKTFLVSKHGLDPQLFKE